MLSKNVLALNTTALFQQFPGVLVCISEIKILLVFHGAPQYSLPVWANITPLSHLYIWKRSRICLKADADLSDPPQ